MDEPIERPGAPKQADEAAKSSRAKKPAMQRKCWQEVRENAKAFDAGRAKSRPRPRSKDKGKGTSAPQLAGTIGALVTGMPSLGGLQARGASKDQQTSQRGKGQGQEGRYEYWQGQQERIEMKWKSEGEGQQGKRQAREGKIMGTLLGQQPMGAERLVEEMEFNDVDHDAWSGSLEEILWQCR